MVDSILGTGRKTTRRSPNRLPRTIGLGTVAVVFALYWLADSFGVDKAELRTYFLTSLGFVSVPVGLAVLAGLVIWVVKRVRGRGRERGEDQGRSAKNLSSRGR